jgi:hypothetical protein
MARFAHSSRSTVVGTTVRSMLSLYGVTGVRARVREIGVFNTTATAVCVAVVRMTNATGVGTGLTETAETDTAQVALATIFAGHTADPTVGGEIRRATLGAAVGSGVIWTFDGLVIPNTTADGVGLITPTGTGQICDIYIGWEE